MPTPVDRWDQRSSRLRTRRAGKAVWGGGRGEYDDDAEASVKAAEVGSVEEPPADAVDEKSVVDQSVEEGRTDVHGEARRFALATPVAADAARIAQSRVATATAALGAAAAAPRNPTDAHTARWEEN